MPCLPPFSLPRVTSCGKPTWPPGHCANKTKGHRVSAPSTQAPWESPTRRGPRLPLATGALWRCEGAEPHAASLSQVTGSPLHSKARGHVGPRVPAPRGGCQASGVRAGPFQLISQCRQAPETRLGDRGRQATPILYSHPAPLGLGCCPSAPSLPESGELSQILHTPRAKSTPRVPAPEPAGRAASVART